MDEVLEYCTIAKGKNGKAKVSFTKLDLFHIALFLKRKGYGRTKIDNQPFYFYREGNSIKKVSFDEFKVVVVKMFRDIEINDLEFPVSNYEIINTFYNKTPLKESNDFKLVMNDFLTKDEIHEISYTYNRNYKLNYDQNSLMEIFASYDFIKSKDEVGNYHKGREIYFKAVGKNKYLVFQNIHETNGLLLPKYDLFLAQYSNKSSVPTSLAISKEVLVLDFNMVRDFHIIDSYLNIKSTT